MYNKPMGKKKRNRGRHAYLKQPDEGGFRFTRVLQNINPFVKGWHAVLAGLADFGLLLMLGIFFYEGCYIPLVWRRGEESIRTLWISVVLGTVCLFLCLVLVCGVRWDKEYSLTTILPYCLHLAYIFLMINAFIDYFQLPEPSNKKDLPDWRAPYMTLMVFLLVEAMALLFYAYDVVRNRERDPPSRWWVRTTPYASIGSIFVIVLLCKKDPLDYSTFYSVAVSVLAVNYLMQIINDRIAPKEGPYKDLHHKADADRSEGGGAVAC